MTSVKRNLKLVCPFHEERYPSGVFSYGLNTYHCFGCGKSATFDELNEKLASVGRDEIKGLK